MAIVLAPDYAERRQVQLDYEENGIEDYEFVRGDYASSMYDDQETLPLDDGLGELVGPEVFMAKHLERLLEAHTQPEPIIGLDIGGGVGITAQRLAIYFKEAVAQSRLAIAVTNMATPNDYADPLLAQELANLKVASGNSVHYMSTLFSRLVRQSVTLPNEQTVPLKRNVHLIHECYSLTSWSQIPELHIRQVGFLLTQNAGIYMVPNSNTTYPLTIGNASYSDSQLKGVQFAHRALQRDFGITRSHEPTGHQFGAADYAVFRSKKPQ